VWFLKAGLDVEIVRRGGLLSEIRDGHPAEGNLMKSEFPGHVPGMFFVCSCRKTEKKVVT
jgi:hypothetical protein